jgi:hypothetical protein
MWDTEIVGESGVGERSSVVVADCENVVDSVTEANTLFDEEALEDNVADSVCWGVTVTTKLGEADGVIEASAVADMLSVRVEDGVEVKEYDVVCALLPTDFVALNDCERDALFLVITVKDVVT